MILLHMYHDTDGLQGLDWWLMPLNRQLSNGGLLRTLDLHSEWKKVNWRGFQLSVFDHSVSYILTPVDEKYD